MKRLHLESTHDDDAIGASSSSSHKRHATLHSSLHHPFMRNLSEPHIHKSNVMYPVFVTTRPHDHVVPGFEPNQQWGNANGYASLVAHLRRLSHDLGLQSVMLFGVVENEAKDAMGTPADAPETNPVMKVLRVLRKELPDLFLAADVCLCEYTDHGHCGILRDRASSSSSSSSSSSNNNKGKQPSATIKTKVSGECSGCDLDNEEDIIDNAATLKRLADAAVSYGRCGCHMVCPSDMMDGRIGSIRSALDGNQLHHVSIMAYTSKKASSFYAPFRQAVDSTFKGNRSRYQHPVGSTSHAMRAMSRDLSENCDVMIVKPSLFYGDLVKAFKDDPNNHVPVAVYVVSGEFVMLKMYGERIGDLSTVLRESHTSLMRAGASLLITYFAPELLEMMKRGVI